MISGFLVGRDQVGIPSRNDPRGFFEEFASRPKAPAPTVEEQKADAGPAPAKREPRKTAAAAK